MYAKSLSFCGIHLGSAKNLHPNDITSTVILSEAKNLAFPDRCKTLHFVQGDSKSKEALDALH
jgi:hypothetical protein